MLLQNKTKSPHTKNEYNKLYQLTRLHVVKKKLTNKNTKSTEIAAKESAFVINNKCIYFATSFERQAKQIKNTTFYKR
jgi:hypothetical protein